MNRKRVPIKAKADKRKIPLFPIVYGRAKAVLGLVPMKTRKDKKAPTTRRHTTEAAKRTRTSRGPGRPRKNAAADTSIQDIAARVQHLQRSHDQMRETMVRIRDLVDGALVKPA